MPFGSTFASLDQSDLPQGTSPVDQEPSTWDQRSSDAGTSADPGLRMAPVESTYPHGQGEVEGCLSGSKFEVFHRNLAEAQSSGRHLIGRRSLRLCDGLGRPVDRQDVPTTDAPSDLARSRSRTAADLQHP